MEGLAEGDGSWDKNGMATGSDDATRRKSGGLNAGVRGRWRRDWSWARRGMGGKGRSWRGDKLEIIYALHSDHLWIGRGGGSSTRVLPISSMPADWGPSWSKTRLHTQTVQGEVGSRREGLKW